MYEPTLAEMREAVQFYEDDLTTSLRFHHLTPRQKRRLAALRAVLRLLEELHEDLAEREDRPPDKSTAPRTTTVPAQWGETLERPPLVLGDDTPD